MEHSEIIKFMKDFKCDFINRNDEMIIDVDYNIYFRIGMCNDVKDMEAYALLVLCRPIGKGIEYKRRKWRKWRKWRELLERFNEYFKCNLTRDDMQEIYCELCYLNMENAVKKFIADGFPMDRLEEYAAMRNQAVP